MDYSVIREKLKIGDIEPTDEGLAYFSHFIQNSENGVSKFYKPYAEAYLKANQLNEDHSIQTLIPLNWDIPFPPPSKPAFTFIDLFAGIGGFRIALQENGGKCIFSSEYNKYAQKAYELNFGEVPFGDITKFNLDSVPPHDVLCAGFPCQPFSISGKMKGFEDTRGTLIYHVFEIIERRQPKVIFLENVKHLVHHNNGETLATIIAHLEEMGYQIKTKLLNAKNFGVPQNRERIIIIGHKTKTFDFEAIKKEKGKILSDMLDLEGDFEFMNEPYTLLDNPKKQESGLIFVGYRNKKIRIAGVRPGTNHLSRVHKQPNRIYSSLGTHPALPSQEVSGRFWVLQNEKVRKLTIRECYRIMGFPEKFKLIYSKSELYRQIGNSVCVPMIKAIGEQIKKQLL
jgi:DNA (cytosine-5)-methyltransferase 1